MDPYQRTLPGQVIKLLPNPLSRIGLVLFLLVLISSCSQDPKEYGVVEGQVNIGPLQPVVREGEDSPTLAPEVYEAREIVVYKKDGRTEYTRLGISPTGWYRGELPVGVYLVDINHAGIDSAGDLPREITILKDTVIRLDIDIDTGIR